MNQIVKRAIAAAMSLTMLAAATPVSPLYNAIQNAVSSVTMQASAAGYNKYIENYDNTDTFSIASTDDLLIFAEAVEGGYDFENKTITLADNYAYTCDMGGSLITLQKPIGCFAGTFDGNNKTILLDVSDADDYAGLFRMVAGATIRNITVMGYARCSSRSGNYCYAGGICGYAINSNINNCTNYATVETGGDNGFAGGICGIAESSNIYNCTNNAAVAAEYHVDYGFAGGICVSNYFDVNVYNCIDTGGNGICGYTSPLQEPDIDNCYVLTESNAEQFKGTDKVSDNKTVTELLNEYVDKFNSTPSNDITLLKWEQGQDYPIFKPKTRAVGASLSLDGQIGVNISFCVNTDEGSTITINDETVDLAQLTSVNGVYTYTLWVAPKDAYNDITFKTVKGSDTIVKQTYSVKSQYVDVVLADTKHTKYNKKVFDMVNALDTYINYARVYFDIETDSDKITEINSAINNIPVVIPSEIETPVFNETMYYGSNLILDSGVKVRHYIKIADGTDISKFKLAVNGNDITDAELTKSGIKSGSDDVYFFETDEFNPIDFDKKVSVTYDGTNVIDKYSVLSYIKLALSNKTTRDTKLGTMCKALYNYYLEAGTY